MDALMQSLDIQCERFASPLNFNPTVKQDYSLHEQDIVFGANVEAYNTKWKGTLTMSQVKLVYNHSKPM